MMKVIIHKLRQSSLGVNKNTCFNIPDEGIASSRRSSLNALIEDFDVEESDISTIRDFYDQYKKSYDTPLCWDCALFRVLGYTEKYDDKRNG